MHNSVAVDRGLGILREGENKLIKNLANQELVNKNSENY